MNFFDIDNTFFTLWNYNVSHLEFYVLITGIIAVALSALANVWSWPIGIVNVVLSFFLFYQVQLYPDMFLYAFFFVTNIIGWWRWTHPKPHEEDRKRELKVSWMNSKESMLVAIVGIAGTLLLGIFARNLSEIFPQVFSKPSAAPFVDSFITVLSIIATYYLVQKKIESWVMWLVVDIVAAILYFTRDIKLTSFLFFIYCLIAAFALWNWVREYRGYSTRNV
jgi:nicotinamide mononucleotide transporter